MKLSIDFSALIQLGKKMLPEGVFFPIDKPPSEFFPIDIGLSGAIAVNIDEIDVKGDILEYKGRQILLYIHDHSRKYIETLNDSKVGNRFHVAWCKTLEEMRDNNRFERYHITNSHDGLFEIDDGLGNNQKTKLNVCMNCLELLDYKGSKDKKIKHEVFETFSVEEFFSTYSYLFPYRPKYNKPSDSGYVKGWDAISKTKREQENYTCSDCGVNLNTCRYLCDVHHKDGNKWDNSPENLVVLCKDCHQKQPYHQNVSIAKKEDIDTIRDLRLAQGPKT